MTTKVLIIAGAGRSGSTFLSQLLSQNIDAYNVGQIRHFPVSFMKDRICSCGQTLSNCAFWGKVARKLKEVHGPRVIAELRAGFDAFQESSNAQTGWSDQATRATIAAQNTRFIELHTDMYKAAAEVAEGAMLIDSSKLPNVSLALMLAPDFDVHHLNLVRDPRAVLSSWAKLVKEDGPLKLRCRQWNARVNQMREISQIERVGYMLIKYEDFTLAPRASIEAIQSWAGLSVSTPYFKDDSRAELSWSRTHMFPPANEEVLKQKATQIEIRPASSWKSEANLRFVEMAEKLNFPVATEVGYVISK